MRRNIIKAVFFGLILNIMTGVMMVAIVDVNGNQVFTQLDRSMVKEYNPEGTTYLQTTFSSSVSPEGEIEDRAMASFRLLDMIGLGWISKIINTINNYLYGLIHFLDAMFGRPMLAGNPGLYKILFGVNGPVLSLGALHILFTIGYAVAVFEIFSNRKAAEE